MLRWYKAWLQDTDNGVKAEAPVRILVKGSNQWVDATEWPLARAHYTDFYLHSNGRANTLYGDGQLSTKAPAGEKPDKFVYDPADPVLFITDPSFAQIGGPMITARSNAAMMCWLTPPAPSPPTPRSAGQSK